LDLASLPNQEGGKEPYDHGEIEQDAIRSGLPFRGMCRPKRVGQTFASFGRSAKPSSTCTTGFGPVRSRAENHNR
jgi:hypothetical protein